MVVISKYMKEEKLKYIFNFYFYVINWVKFYGLWLVESLFWIIYYNIVKNI